MKTAPGRRNPARRRQCKGQLEGNWRSVWRWVKEDGPDLVFAVLVALGIFHIIFFLFIKPDSGTVASGEAIDQLCHDLGHEELLGTGWASIDDEKKYGAVACRDGDGDVRYALIPYDDLRTLLDGRPPRTTPQGSGEPIPLSAPVTPSGGNLSVLIPRAFMDRMAAAYEVHSGEFLVCLYGSEGNGIYTIARMEKSVLVESTTDSILALCPDRNGLMAELHSHPGIGPIDPCQPSKADIKVHKERGQPLQGIFCGGDRIGFFTEAEPTKSLPVVLLNATGEAGNKPSGGG